MHWHCGEVVDVGEIVANWEGQALTSERVWTNAKEIVQFRRVDAGTLAETIHREGGPISY